MSEPISVLVCEDIEPIRRKYSMIVSRTAELRLAGAAADGREAVRMAEETRPDVILMDIEMESPRAGIEATEQILKFLPGCRVIILTVHSDDELIFDAFGAGAIDYVLKNASPKELVRHILNAGENVSSFSPEISAKLRREIVAVHRSQTETLNMMARLFALCLSELEIVELYMNGMTRADINELRSVNMSTTKSQIRSILSKTGYGSMKELTGDLVAMKLDSFIRRVLAEGR